MSENVNTTPTGREVTRIETSDGVSHTIVKEPGRGTWTITDTDGSLSKTTVVRATEGKELLTIPLKNRNEIRE